MCLARRTNANVVALLPAGSNGSPLDSDNGNDENDNDDASE